MVRTTSVRAAPRRDAAVSEDRVLRLISAIYDAALHEDRWPTTLETIGDALGGCAFVTSVQRPRSDSKLLATAHIDPHYRAVLAQHYRCPETNPLVAVMPRLPTATAIARETVYPDPEYFRGGLWNDVFRAQGLAHVAVSCILRTPDCFVPMGVLRRLAAPFDRQEWHLLAHLLPHLQRALQLHMRIAAMDTQQAAAQEVLDRLPFGVIVVDPGGRVLRLNRAAEALAVAADGIVIRGGRLSALAPGEARALKQLIDEAAATGAGRGLSPGGAVALSRLSMARPLAVLVCPLPSGNSGLAPGGAAAVVFISDPERKERSSETVLIRLFGLSRTEAKLACLMVQGADLAEAADQLGITMNTARTHLKRTFEKTETNRQAQLVRLILRSPAGFVAP